MSNWKKTEDEGITYYVNEDIGNIIKVDDAYVVMIPKILKFGPFKTLKEAKDAAENKQEGLAVLLEQFNADLIKIEKI